MGGVDILLLAFMITAFALLFLFVELYRDAKKRLRKAWQKNEHLERVLYDKDYIPCAVCGNLYSPLMDPEYQPELSICRDCLWKLYHEKMFSEEDADE